jgi:tetratricopeptide (TPR) repeat protein
MLAVASVLMTLSLASPVHAQQVHAQQGDLSDEETAAKVLRMVKNANDEFDRGEYADALEIYEKAYQMYPDPVLLYRIGLAAEKNGELRRAADSYEAFVKASDEGDPVAQRVAKKLPDIRAKLAPIVTVQSDPPGADIFIGAIGDEPVGQTPAEIELEQGTSTIVLRLEGYRVARQELALENGQREDVQVQLEELRKLSTIETKDTAPPPADTGPDLGTWGWAATGTGAALLGTGVAFSILTASTTSDVNDYDKRAPGASREELDDLMSRAESLYKTSVACYVVGGVFASVGATLLTIDYLSSDSGAAPDEGSVALRLRVAPTASGGWIGLNGRF